MSEVSNPIKVEETKEVPEQTQELVSKKVVEEYKNDMFKYKARMKETEVELQKLRDDKALMEKTGLEEKEEWKLLYEREKTEKSKAVSDLENKSKFFIDTSKKNAVVQQLGGFKKDSYTRFIDTSKIDVSEDGTFNTTSIQAEVDRIKQEFPELLKVGSDQSKMPNEAPANYTGAQNRSLGNLSSSELLNLYSKVKTN